MKRIGRAAVLVVVAALVLLVAERFGTDAAFIAGAAVGVLIDRTL